MTDKIDKNPHSSSDGNDLTLETPIDSGHSENKGMTRRDLLKPAAVGVTMLGLGGLSTRALANHSSSGSGLVPTFDSDEHVPVRQGLGVVIVGASSGLGAELARQYAAHGAYIVLAARRTDRLNDVAAEVTNLGGVAHVITTDVRKEPACERLIKKAERWLERRGKVIDVLALAPIRGQMGALGPELSMDVFRNVVDTNLHGPVFCLKHALPHLKANASTVFYFNSISSSVGVPFTLGYAASKHAWKAIMSAVQMENPELTVVSSQFNAIDTEGFDKELTYFDNDTRYCPPVYKTYFLPASQMYPEPFAIEKVVRAIETKTSDVFLSLLNKAAWLVGFTRQELGWFLLQLESGMGHELVIELEAVIKDKFSQRGAEDYVNRLLRKVERPGEANELVETATYLRSVDWSVALYLLALDDLLPEDILPTTRATVQQGLQGVGDGSLKQFTLALAGGAGIAADNDGLAPVTLCSPSI